MITHRPIDDTANPSELWGSADRSRPAGTTNREKSPASSDSAAPDLLGISNQRQIACQVKRNTQNPYSILRLREEQNYKWGCSRFPLYWQDGQQLLISFSPSFFLLSFRSYEPIAWVRINSWDTLRTRKTMFWSTINDQKIFLPAHHFTYRSTFKRCISISAKHYNYTLYPPLTKSLK